MKQFNHLLQELLGVTIFSICLGQMSSGTDSLTTCSVRVKIRNDSVVSAVSTAHTIMTSPVHFHYCNSNFTITIITESIQSLGTIHEPSVNNEFNILAEVLYNC